MVVLAGGGAQRAAGPGLKSHRRSNRRTCAAVLRLNVHVSFEDQQFDNLEQLFSPFQDIKSTRLKEWNDQPSHGCRDTRHQNIVLSIFPVMFRQSFFFYFQFHMMTWALFSFPARQQCAVFFFSLNSWNNRNVDWHIVLLFPILWKLLINTPQDLPLEISPPPLQHRHHSQFCFVVCFFSWRIGNYLPSESRVSASSTRSVSMNLATVTRGRTNNSFTLHIYKLNTAIQLPQFGHTFATK